MKTRFVLICLWVCIFAITGAVAVLPARAQQFAATSSATSTIHTATSAPTYTPYPTHTPQFGTPTVAPTQLTPTPASLDRPFIVIQEYHSDYDIIQPGTEFTITMTIANTGESPAYNLVVSFSNSSDALPVRNGGVHTIPFLDTGASVQIQQPMLANNNLSSMPSVPVQVSCTDENNLSYNQSYILAFQASPTYPTATYMPAPTEFRRPFITLQNYETGIGLLIPGQPFTLTFIVSNTGQINAMNVALTFEGSDFFPVETVGVYNVSRLGAGNQLPVSQPMLVNKDLGTKSVVSSVVKVTYNDDAGKTYEERYTMTFPTINVTATTTPTVTPTVWLRPQLLVAAYTTSVDMLHPGDEFDVELQVSNMGVNTAHAVNMTIGTVTTDTNNSSGTPEANSSSSTTTSTSALTFAPVNSANRKFLGDISVNMTIKTKQKLIVNVESAAGAQPLTITFTYTDDKGSSITETQTITLLVYSPMQIDVSFSGATPALIVDEGAPLTLQVTNLGKKTVLLGSLEAKGDDMDVEAANTIIGSLDSGGFFTADVKITPKKAGALKLMVRIHYLDDFGKQRALSRSLLIKAEQPPTPIPVMEDTSQQAGTGLWDQIVRFIKGLFGLESAPAEGTLPSGAPEGQPMPLVEPQG